MNQFFYPDPSFYPFTRKSKQIFSRPLILLPPQTQINKHPTEFQFNAPLNSALLCPSSTSKGISVCMCVCVCVFEDLLWALSHSKGHGGFTVRSWTPVGPLCLLAGGPAASFVVCRNNSRASLPASRGRRIGIRWVAAGCRSIFIFLLLLISYCFSF